MANNKVQLADGTVLVDLTDTTAVASDVGAGKYFYGADGVKTLGTATVGDYGWVDELKLSLEQGTVSTIIENTDNVSSISASFSPGNTVIYNTDSLEKLRKFLTVMATFSDTTESEVDEYTLSGSLTVGTSIITVTYGTETTTFNVTVTANPLDQIAYGELTYRDIFITGNLITDYIGNFDGHYPWHAAYVFLKTGDAIEGAAEAAIPAYATGVSLTDEYCISKPHSLKCFSTSEAGVSVRNRTACLLANTTILVAANIKCDRYVGGVVGARFQAPISSSVEIISASVNGITNGFVPVAKIGTTAAKRVDWACYIGNRTSSGNADSYIDAVVVSIVPNEMTEAEAQQLYENYTSYILGGAT